MKKSTDQTVAHPAGDSLESWLERVRPFHGGQKHLIRQILAVGIKKTYEIVQLIEQAKTFVGVINPSSLSDELNAAVIKLVDEIIKRRNGEKRRADYRKLIIFGTHESINDDHIVGEVRSTLGMKKKILEGIGDASFNNAQALHGLFVVWKVVEALRLFKEGEFEEFGVSLLIAAKGTYAAKKISWVATKTNIKSTTLSKERSGKSKGGKERHKNSASEKGFVKECWIRWQSEPEDDRSYNNKSDFARDMLKKCNYVKGKRTIPDWCREWEIEYGTKEADSQ